MILSRFALIFALVAAMGPSGSNASTVELFIDPCFGSTENTGSTATVTLGFGEVGADDLLTLMFENTTAPEIGSKLTAVGLELPDYPSLRAVFANEGAGMYFDELTFDEPVSPGWLDAPGGYDLMITSDQNFLGGNPTGAPEAGETHTIILNLGDTGLTPLELGATFEDFYASLDGNYAVGRFQSVGPGGELSDKVGGEIPEPTTLLLLLLGGCAILRRKS